MLGLTGLRGIGAFRTGGERLPPSSAVLARWLRGSPTGLIALALVIGGAAGAGAVGFRYLIEGCTYLLTGYADVSGVGRSSYGFASTIGPWFVLFVPVVGGLLYGPLISLFAGEARGHGVPEVMLAVAERGGRIRPRVAVVKSLASALCIGSGGSVGREGPIVQIGSALGSTLGQVVRLPDTRLRTLVACGAAGGVSATFNAPIAGTFFGLELILRDFEADSFGVVVLSSFVADIIGRAAFGSHPFLELPAFQLHSPVEYLLYAGLGIVAAIVGLVFIRALYGCEDVVDRVWRGPDWLRPAVGGVLLGGLLLALPELYGVGYPPLEKAIRSGYAIWFLLLLLGGKILAASLTIAIGGSGGVFAPSLFMGAMLGTAYGETMHHLMPGFTGSAGAYGLVGMGAVFAGAARAPITSVIIIFELTGDYRIILPLMSAIALSAGISTLVSRDTIYTLKLRRRGIDLLHGRLDNPMQLVRVQDAMSPVRTPARQTTTLTELIALLTEASSDSLPVVDDSGAYSGTVTLRHVEQAIRENSSDATAYELAEEVPPLRATATLEEALGALLRTRSGVPVVGADGRRLIGWLDHVDVLGAYNARLGRGLDDGPRGRSASGLIGSSGRARSVMAPPRGFHVVDLERRAGRALLGRRLDELSLPHAARVVALRRGGRTLEPTGDIRLQRGDRLTVIAPLAQTPDLEELFAGGAVEPKEDGDGDPPSALEDSKS